MRQLDLKFRAKDVFSPIILTVQSITNRFKPSEILRFWLLYQPYNHYSTKTGVSRMACVNDGRDFGKKIAIDDRK